MLAMLRLSSFRYSITPELPSAITLIVYILLGLLQNQNHMFFVLKVNDSHHAFFSFNYG
jgi:hypothetical protein